MFSLTQFLTGVVILSISPVNCVGTAFIANWCSFEVYVWSVANVTNNTINYLAPIIGEFSETYRTNPNGGGISLKISMTPVDSNITQFEYTYHINDSNIFYDISNVNGYPFEEWGLALSPSSPNCSSISCDPYVPVCADVYNQPSDFATKNCDVSANLTLTLCPYQRTSTETATATITTTDAAGDTSLTTITTVISPVEPTTILSPSQTTLTETLTMTTDAAGDTVLTTITTVISPVEPTTILSLSQTTLTETLTATVMTTDAAGETVLTTLTTVISPVEPMTILSPSQTTLTETLTITTDAAGDTVLTTLTTVISPVEPTTILSPSQTTSTETITITATDAAGNTILTTLTAVISPVVPTTISVEPFC